MPLWIRRGRSGGQSEKEISQSKMGNPHESISRFPYPTNGFHHQNVNSSDLKDVAFRGAVELDQQRPQ